LGDHPEDLVGQLMITGGVAVFLAGYALHALDHRA
jgi:hypothetical protein